MASESIGKVESGKGKKIEVFWDQRSGEVYVAYAGKTKIPTKAASAKQAANMAEVWLRDK